MPYAIMYRGYPWFTPYLLCNNWPDPSSVLRTTIVDQ